MDWGIIGHEWAVDLLKEQIRKGKLRHAYLITGPDGVGRRTLATRLVQAINCPQSTTAGDPCLCCRTCQNIERMTHPDLAIVQAEQRGGVLKVDQIRELQRVLALAPYEAPNRTAVLLRFEEANIHAANALLKTLEEPAPSVVILLTAESAEKLLPTVVSRCELLRLRPAGLSQVSHWLENQWGLSAEEAETIAHISGGRPGYALRLHQEPQYLARREKWIAEHKEVLSSNRVARFFRLASILKRKDPSTARAVLSEMFLVWISLWRDVLLISNGANTPITNLDEVKMVTELANQVGKDTAHRMVVVIQRTLYLMERNVNLRLAAELMILDLPYAKLGQPSQ